MKNDILKLLLLSLLATVSLPSQAHAEAAPKDFTLNSLDGGPVSLHDYLGQKTIVINFWAAWCDSCEEEMPLLLKLQNKYSNGDVVFLGVDAGDSASAAKKFVDRLDYTYKILLDADKSVAKAFQVMGVPQTVVISKDGSIIFRGSRPPESINDPATKAAPVALQTH